MPAAPIAAEDLEHVLAQAQGAFASLGGANLFVTGGTGFFGHSLLESLIYANRAVKADLRATVLTRSINRFRATSPHIADDPAITLLEGDVRSFDFPPADYSHVLHAATDSSGQQHKQSPEALAESILSGTKRVLDFAAHIHAARLLYTSTGAVYGRSTTLPHTPESFLDTAAPKLAPNSYEDAKRRAELLCLARPDLQCVIARCFAFVGPHLPLDRHFAIGNFIGSALAGRPIHIKGDGTPRRSWLYTADLAVWLWTMLAFGAPGQPYNVGSDDGHTIAEAARITAATLHPHLPIQIDGIPDPTAPLNSYVPDISRATAELGLRVLIPLEEALRRTAAWNTAK